MKLEITLTDEQAAPIIAALELLAHPQMTLTPAPALPEPPEGFHKAIMGPLKVQAEKPTSDILMWQDGIWKDLGFNGNSTIPYALRIGSEIAKLNGIEPEAIPADKEPEQVKPWEQPCPKCSGDHWSTNCPKPEPAKRREWDASVCRADGEIFQRDDNDDPKRWEYVHVREVLPGDPTMEQVEELVKAVERLSEVWFEAKNGKGGLANEIRAQIDAALQPFTGKESK